VPKLVFQVVFIVSFLAASEAPSRAQNEVYDPCANLRAGVGELMEPELAEIDGTQGTFFPAPLDRLVLCEVRALRVRNDEIRLLDSEVEIWAQQIEFLKTQLELAVQARNRLLEIVEEADRLRREADERANRWWRSPILWMCVGAVVAGVLFYGAIRAIDALRE